MKKIIAIVIGLLLIPTPAQADLITLDNYNIGTVSTHIKFAPTTVYKNDLSFTFDIFIDNSRYDIQMAYVSLFNCNGGLIGYKRFYVYKYGIDNFEDTYGNGNSSISKKITFNQKYGAPQNCIWDSYRLEVAIWQVGMDNSTEISRNTSGKYKTNVLDVPINGQQFTSSLALGVPEWKNPYTATVEQGFPSLQNHINEIQKITDAWNAATKALEEQKRLEAEAKAKAEAEARAKQILINSQNYAIDLYSGKSCWKKGKSMIISEITFQCVSKGKKLVWRVK